MLFLASDESSFVTGATLQTEPHAMSPIGVLGPLPPPIGGGVPHPSSAAIRRGAVVKE